VHPATAADHVNTLVDFCARRDVEVLAGKAVEDAAGGRIDAAILFGGSILAGGDLFAAAIKDGIADRFLIVGGQGHSTDALRDAMRECLGWDGVDNQTEAALFDRYLRERHGIKADLLETASTNCGNNVQNALAVLEAEHIPGRRLVIIQDASMQLRMHACFQLHAPDTRVVSFAAHQTKLDAGLGYVAPPLGMWTPDRYIGLLLGEVQKAASGCAPATQGSLKRNRLP
jgi:uncharacterized SAM-binding protein YcdF (DUF218 family)